MGRRRLEDADILLVSRNLGVPVEEARRIVHSFFDDIGSRARRLPFADTSRIHKRNSFDKYLFAVNIPYVGRIGPVYSRYLKWLENESGMSGQELRKAHRWRLTKDEVESLAADILSGRTPNIPERKKGNEIYKRIWLVDADRKRLARQVFPKKD